KSLVVLLPQLGEFDSSEYTEFLTAASPTLEENNIDLQVIGIGDTIAARKFCEFTKLPTEKLCIDPEATLYKELDLYAGPNFSLPDVANAWFNYLLMCAGIGAPGTLREILRGYFGDKKAPERFRDDDVVKAGFITIGPGVGPWFADEKGYQRPVELATIRLKNMVEVLTKWDQYVRNPLVITQRGATFLFDEEGNELYSYKTPGVLTYSDTMARPLTFL
ncbi:hypothetical protein THAPSDRAFT_261637, partial [Thalassiosira pseudonana CCMP1335]